MAAGECEGGFLAALDATKWLDFIKLILESASKVVAISFFPPSPPRAKSLIL